MKKTICYLTLLVALFCIAGCKKDPITLLLPNPQSPTPLTQISADTINENGEVCITRKMKWGPHYSDVLSLNPQDDVVYPGAVFNYESFQDGSYQPISGDRKPITFSTSLPGGGGPGKTTVDEPSLSSVRDGIREILNPYSGATAAKLFFHGEEIYSKEHFALSVGGNLSSNSFDLSAQFSFDNTAVKSRYLIEFSQEYYSIDLDIPPAGMEHWFEKPSKVEDQLDNISPVYVSSIRYGRKVFILVESESFSYEQLAGLETSFSIFNTDVAINVDQTMEKLVNEKSIKVAVMGGSAEDATKLINNIDELSEFLNRGANYNQNNPGVPLGYTMRFVGDNSIADLRQYGEFTIRECVPNSAEVAIPDQLFLCPDHVGGDNEFNGNDPFIKTKVQVEVSLDKKSVLLKVTFHAKENGGDFTEAYKQWEWKIFTDPLGRNIHSIDSDNFFEHETVDASDLLYEDKTMPVTELVRKIEIMGDTAGPDLGNCGPDFTFLSLYFNPLKVKFE